MKRSKAHALACWTIGLALIVLAAARAAAQFPPHVRQPGVPIPANGAIVIESPDGTEPVLLVRASGGAIVEGAHHRIGVLPNLGAIYVWLPKEPFQLGTYSVQQNHQQSGEQRDDTITVIEPHDGTPPSVMIEPSVSMVVVPGERACCKTPNHEDIDRCTIISSITSAQVSAGLSSVEPASKINQFLFRFESAASADSNPEKKVFGTFENAGPIAFDEPSELFCFSLRALDVVTLEQHVYSDLAGCVPRGDVTIGVIASDPPPAFFDMRRCPVPPPRFERPWCSTNDWACTMGSMVECELHQHVCDDGPLPSLWRAVPEGFAAPERDRGCAVAPRRSDGHSWIVWLALGLALVARRRTIGIGGVTALVAWMALPTSARAIPSEVSVTAQPGEGALQRVRMPGVPIPANGAILIESIDGSWPEVEVLDSDGSPVAGSQQVVGELANRTTIFAWLPEQTFLPGAYSVTTIHPFDSPLAQLDEIVVIEAFDDAPPEIMSAPSASEITGDFETVCCQTPVDDLARECAVVRQTSILQVDGGLSSSAPAAKLNQFLFRYTVRTGIGTATVSPMPLEALQPIRFVNDADAYCFALIAVNVATMERHTYDDLPSCADRGELFLGTVELEPTAAFFDPQKCPFPPPPYQPEWCEINEGVCEAGAAAHCEQYEYICNDGPRPERWSSDPGKMLPRIDFSSGRDAGDEAVAVRNDSSGSDASCSAAAIGSEPRSTPLAWLAFAIAFAGLWLRYAPRRHETLRSFPPRCEPDELQDAGAQARLRARRLRGRQDAALER
jgi:hypothetical protein